MLELQIGSAPYKDILAAGGVFLSGGYNKTIKTDPPGDNPLDGGQAWSGLSGGFITTQVDSNWSPLLPAMLGTGGELKLQDTNLPVYPSRSYRVRTY